MALPREAGTESSMVQLEIASRAIPRAALRLDVAKMTDFVTEERMGRPIGAQSIDSMMADFEEMLADMEARAGGGGKKATEEGHGARRGCEQHRIEFDPECGEVCVICGLVTRDLAGVQPEFEERISRPKLTAVETWVGSLISDSDDDDDAVSSEDSQSRLVDSQQEEVVRRGLDTIEELAKVMKPHQINGFHFLWRNVGENGGCILAHSPGTGKSLTVIAFMKSYWKMHQDSRMLIVAPLCMLRVWREEFLRWKVSIPLCTLHSQAMTGKDASKAEANPVQRVHGTRAAVLENWKKGGVMITTYETLHNVVYDSRSFTGEAKKNKDCLITFTDVLVLDEGHKIRTKGKMRNAVQQIKTRRRIIMSGTLFQNNVRELGNLLYVVRPNCLANEVTLSDSEDELRARIEPHLVTEDKVSRTRVCTLRSGKTAAISQQLPPFRDKKQVAFDKGCKERFPCLFNTDPQAVIEQENLDREIYNWKQLTDPFVDYFVWKKLEILPSLNEYVIKLIINPEQRQLLKMFREEQKQTDLVAHVKTEKICIHPILHTIKELEIKREVYGRARPEDGVKTHIVMKLVEQFVLLKERAVIFCMQVEPLLLLQGMLEERFRWSLHREILILNGTKDTEDRHMTISAVNNLLNEVKVVLASTRAFGEGVSMVGASRVIHMGMEWNPSVNRQATCRAYRLGQEKDVHVYRLLASNTIEEEKYNSALWKDKLGRKILAPANERQPGAPNLCPPAVPTGLQDAVLERICNRDVTRSIAQVVKLVEPINISDAEQVGQIEHLVYNATPTSERELEQETGHLPKNKLGRFQPEQTPIPPRRGSRIQIILSDEESVSSEGKQEQQTADLEIKREPDFQSNRQAEVPDIGQVEPLDTLSHSSSTSEGEHGQNLADGQLTRKRKPDSEPRRPRTRSQRIWSNCAPSTPISTISRTKRPEVIDLTSDVSDEAF